MAQKRKYTEMSSDPFPSEDPSSNVSNEPEPELKRRRINRLDLINSAVALKANINVPNQTNSNSATEHLIVRNLRNNRITTKMQIVDKNHKNIEYVQAKQRILTQSPSPITSPECAPSLSPSTNTNTSAQSPSNHNNLSPNTSPLQISFEHNANDSKARHISPTIHDTKRKLEFDIEDDENKNIQNASHKKTIVSDDVPRSLSLDCVRVETERSKLFRNYVANHLDEHKERIQRMCMIFVILFGIWSVVNILCLNHYHSIDVLLWTLTILMIAKDLSECNGDCAVYILILFTFLMEISIEFMIGIYCKPNGVIFDAKLINNEIAYVLLMVMIYLLCCSEYHLFDAVVERIFNRGMERRLISYFMYFWFNGHRICLLISFLYDIKPETHFDFGYVWTSYLNLFVLCSYIAMVIGLWLKLQDTKFIAVEQFKVNEICGFIAMVVVHYSLFFSDLNDGNMTHQHYVLLIFIVVFVLNKIFYF